MHALSTSTRDRGQEAYMSDVASTFMHWQEEIADTDSACVHCDCCLQAKHASAQLEVARVLHRLQ